MIKKKDIYQINEDELDKVIGGETILLDFGDDPNRIIQPEKYDYVCGACGYNFGKYEKNVVFLGGIYCPNCKINVDPVMKD